VPNAISCPDKPSSDERASADVVFTFSYLTWEGAARRKWFMPEDRLVQSLLADERIGRVLVADTQRRLPVKLARDLVRSNDSRFRSDGRAELVQPVRLWRAQPASRRAVERSIAGYDRTLRRAAERAGLVQPAVITANPLVAGFAELSWARTVTFYAVDDWTRSGPYRRWWAAYREAYARIRARGVRIGAVSPGLRERLAEPGTGVIVPNGLEPAEWNGDPSPPPWATPERPLLIYAGTLDGRLDVPAITETALALPHARVVLVGPVADGRPLDSLRAVPNVEIRPALGRDQYAGLLRSAHVGLIPHVRSELTATIEPQKVYEYLAGGLRVVASDLPPLHGISRHVALVPEAGDFAGPVRGALAAGRVGEDERLAFVGANSWRARHDALIELAIA
jgi:glycosyltransferase involved in cell wall biosynthesis